MNRNFIKLIYCLTLFSASVSAQVEITSDGGVVRGIPIAVVPFKTIDATTTETEMHTVIAADLDASGKFESIATEKFMSFPSRDEEVRYKDWRFVDAEALVIGEIWKTAEDQFEVHFRIYDVAREQQVGYAKRIPNLTANDLRSAAHIISDNVYQGFTGRPGAFNSQIAYIEKSQVEYQRYRYRLLVADWDGYGAQEVFASWQPLLSPSWSPDLSQLAFVSFTDNGPVVKVLNLRSGQHQTIAAFKGINSAPAWSPDGSKIAYSTSRNGSPDVYVYDVLSKQHQRINTHYGIDTEPEWTPDGRKLIYTSSRTGKPQLYSYDMVSGENSRMTFEGDENANGSYDWEGKRILMVTDGGKIAIMQQQNNQITWLTNAKFDESPSFSPNGDMVLYASEQDYEPALIVASSDGRRKTRLKFVNGDVREPAWSPLKQ